MTPMLEARKQISGTGRSFSWSSVVPFIVLVLVIGFAAAFSTLQILDYPVLVDVGLVLFAGLISRGPAKAPEARYNGFLLDMAFLVASAAMTLAATDLMRAIFNYPHDLPGWLDLVFVFLLAIGATFIYRTLWPLLEFTTRPRFLSIVTYVATVAIYVGYRLLAEIWLSASQWITAITLFVFTLTAVLTAGFAVRQILFQRILNGSRTISNLGYVFPGLVLIGLFLLATRLEEARTQGESRAMFAEWSDGQSLCVGEDVSPSEYCVRVHYGTTRAITNVQELRFEDEFDARLHLGYADVRLPLKLPIRNGGGGGEHPLFNRRDPLRLESEFAQRVSVRVFHGTGTTSFEAEGEAFRKSLSEELAFSDDSALVYIHGFNQSFDTALAGAAQLAVDLTYADGRPIDNKLDPRILYRAGAPILFSWPTSTWDDSNAPTEKLGIYLDDRKRAKQSAPYLAEFLRLLIEKGGVKKVNIVLHSMGNRVFMESLDDIEKAIREVAAARDVEFTVVHAASEYERESYLQKLEDTSAGSDRRQVFLDRLLSNVWIYTSATDRALKAGDQIKSAGIRCAMGNWAKTSQTASCRSPFVVDGGSSARFTTIDASGFVLSLDEDTASDDYGHSYYLNAPAVLADLGCAFAGAGVDSGRRALSPEVARNADDEEIRYWRFEPVSGTDPSCRVIHWRKRLDGGREDCARIEREIGYTCSEIRALEQKFDEWRVGQRRGESSSAPAIPAPRFSTLEEVDSFVGDCLQTSDNIQRDEGRLIVYFRLNSDILDRRQIAAIEEFAYEADERTILVEGYADSSGDEKYNRSLSLRRAQAVRTAVAGRAAVTIEGRGDDNESANSEGRVSELLRCAVDRRAELSFIDQASAR